MSDVTLILDAISQGDPQAAERLLPLVYNELRQLAAGKMAREKPGHTLQATALVHEAYVRLVDAADVQQFNSRGHFFAAAAEAMRRILVENARAKLAQKRGGDYQRISLDELDAGQESPPGKVLALHEALDHLTEQDPVKAELVKLRFFAGFTNREAADTLGLSTATAERYWSYARAWLQTEIASLLDS